MIDTTMLSGYITTTTLCLSTDDLSFISDARKSKKCFMKDDAANIAEKVQHADVIAFATPIYYYEMCGQMKTLLDRMNPLYTSEYAFRDIYLLTTAAENDESAMDGAVKGMQGLIVLNKQGLPASYAELASVMRAVQKNILHY